MSGVVVFGAVGGRLNCGCLIGAPLAGVLSGTGGGGVVCLDMDDDNGGVVDFGGAIALTRLADADCDVLSSTRFLNGFVSAKGAVIGLLVIGEWGSGDGGGAKPYSMPCIRPIVAVVGETILGGSDMVAVE